MSFQRLSWDAHGFPLMGVQHILIARRSCPSSCLSKDTKGIETLGLCRLAPEPRL